MNAVKTFGLVAMSLTVAGCLHAFEEDPAEISSPTSENGAEPPEMDVVLVSDLLRYHLDGDMGVDRAIADCYDGICVQTDGERILLNLPEWFVFAGHHDDKISAREETIEDRNGIMIGDVSLGEKDLPDIPNFATDRTITGYGGWGKYVGFDSLYYDYERKSTGHEEVTRQRIVEATVGGWGSEGNPPETFADTVTWTGGAVGIDYSVITADRVLVGDSELSVYVHARLGEFMVKVDITDMTDVATGTKYDDMSWRNIPLREGEFETFEIRGHFFGPNHEEVGGVFEREQIIGAFAASREDE